MKVAVSSQNKKTITGHAGKTSRFFIYTIEDSEVTNKNLLELEKDEILHTRFHDSENPWAPHPIFEVDVVITGGAGMGFVNRMARMKTQVIITPETDPDDAIKLFLQGNLSSQDPHQHHHHH